jgi:hypothetical protein
MLSSLTWQFDRKRLLPLDSVEKPDALRPKHFFEGTFTLAVIAIVDPGAI